MTNSRAVVHKNWGGQDAFLTLSDFSRSNDYNISSLLLISSGHDWVNHLSKSWMLDYSLYKIIDIFIYPWRPCWYILQRAHAIRKVLSCGSCYCATALHKWHKYITLPTIIKAYNLHWYLKFLSYKYKLKK